MSASPKRNLLQRSVIIFGWLVLLLPILFKLSSLILKPVESGSHIDQKASEIFHALELALRPIDEVTQRITNLEEMKAISTCLEKEKTEKLENIFANVGEVEERLKRLAGVSEDGKPHGNRRFSKRLVIDAAKWKMELSRVNYSCNDLARGLAMLARDNAAVLESAEWRRNEWPKDQWLRIPKSAITRPNPWGGLPGCILLDGEGVGSRWYASNGRNDYCAEFLTEKQPEKEQFIKRQSTKDNAWILPDSLDYILVDVAPMRHPSNLLYRDAMASERTKPNRLQREGHELDVGFNIRLTINPAAQRIAQQTARCYAGHSEACKALGLSKAEIQKIGAEFYEHAAVRMTGVAIIDVTTGKIDAIASAHTECYRQQYDGPGRDAHCPNLPRKPSANPDMLLNHALYSDAMPASTIKPLLALGFLETTGYHVIQGELTQELKTSNSARFLDRLFCFDSGNVADCHRLAQAQIAAEQLGWNSGCMLGGEDCGFDDVLFGRIASERLDTEFGKQRPFGLRNLYGRLFALPERGGNAARMKRMSESDLQFNPDKARECHQKRWEECARNPVAKLSNEGWGQGNARATPLGVAGMFARLGVAAQGSSTQRRPYLIEDITDVSGKPLTLLGFMPAEAEKLAIPTDLASRVVEGLRQGHWKGGTANLGCENAGIGKCDKTMSWVAGKTGTPPFSDDKVTLTQAESNCLHKKDKRCEREIPYKWYAALFQSGAKRGVFDKAIAVLSERNWYESGKLQGKVDAPGDNGANRSAEIAFRIMKKLRDEMTTPTKGGQK